MPFGGVVPMNSKIEATFERLKKMVRDGSLKTDIFERQFEQKLAHIDLMAEDGPVERGSDRVSLGRDSGGGDHETTYVD